MPGVYVRARAVFLTIDSATVSGVALSEPDLDGRGTCRGYDIDSFGLATTQAQRDQWAVDARELAEDYELPLIVIGEEWSRHGLSKAAYDSLVEHWGMWRAAFERAGIDPRSVVRVQPDPWRNALFGKHRAKSRAGLKLQAVKYVQLQLGIPNLQDDIAEALCLRVWGVNAAEVHAAIKALSAPKKKRKSA